MKKLSSFRKAIVLFAAVLFGIASVNASNNVLVAQVTLISPTSGNTSYTSIQAAYNAVDFGTTAGAYTIQISSSYNVANETFPITLGAKVGASESNTITIKPATGAAVVIANPAVTATVNKTIVFDGASYVTIDGVARTGATSLTIQNPNTESAHTIFFTNGAMNNTVKNCFVKGASVTKGTASMNNALIYFDAQANIGNKIEDNDICDLPTGTDKPVTMILLNNTGASAAEYNTIQNNNIYNYNYVATTANGVPAAVHVMGASANARILDNKIFWTGTIANTTAAIYGITFDATSIGAESRVEGNVIGGTASDNSGIATFNTTGNFTPINTNLNSTVKNNVVKNMTFSTTGTNGYMINIAANGTGLADANAWTGNTVADIEMTYTAAAGNTLAGLYITATAATPARNINNNTFYNLKLISTANATTIIRVIYVNSTVPTALWSYSGNTMYNIFCDKSTSSATHGVVGIDTRANTSIIEKNLIYNFKSTNTGSKETVMHAIRLNGNNSSGTTIKNNVVSIGNGITGNAQIRGIVHSGSGTAGQTVNIFHNTVYIGGSQSNLSAVFTAISSAFYRDGSIVPNLTIKNNIFVVKRTTTQAGEPFSAIFLATAISNLATSDNNILVAPVCVRINTGSVSYVTLANWRTATTDTKDMNSSDVDPGFVDDVSTITDLHISSANSSANSKGDVNVPVTDDFAGAARADYSPTDIGAYVIAGSTSVENAIVTNRNILALSNAIQFNNLSGKAISVYTLNGQLVKATNLKADNETISIGAGMYIVKADGQNVKVLVK